MFIVPYLLVYNLVFIGKFNVYINIYHMVYRINIKKIVNNCNP